MGKPMILETIGMTTDSGATGRKEGSGHQSVKGCDHYNIPHGIPLHAEKALKGAHLLDRK